MHPIVGIQEIRDLIFAEEGIGDQEWLSLALTCRSFQDMGLDKIWDSIKGIQCLVRTMSRQGDLWTLKDGVLILLRDFRDPDWERLRFYSRRVREIRITGSLAIDAKAFSALCSYSPSQPILPHVKSISCFIECKETVELFPYFLRSLSKELEEIDLDLDPAPISNDMCEAYLTILAESRQTIKMFRVLFLSGAGHEFSSIFEDFVMRLPNLEELTCPDIHVTPRLLRHLAQHPTLLEWRWASIRRHEAALLATCRQYDLCFNHLRSLGLGRCAYTSVVNLLKTLRCRLEELSVRPLWAVVDDSLENLEELCSLIATRFPQLTSLAIHKGGVMLVRSDRTASAKQEFISSVISKLFPLRLLHVELGIPYVRYLSRSDLCKIAAAWPGICTLNLSEYFLVSAEKKTNPIASMEDILPIVNGCKDLEDLTISVYCRPFDVSQLSEGGNSSISRVVFRHSPIELGDISNISNCLKKMFPKAQTIEGDGHGAWTAFSDLYATSH